jgi:hypothetical protein
MADGLDALRSYGSDSNATSSEDDGGSGFHPSHGELDMHKKNAVEDSVDDASDSTRSSINALMAERHARIQRNKLKRRGFDDSEEEQSEKIFGRNPYRQLEMYEKYTPPRKKSRLLVPDSDDYPPSENGNEEDDESGDDVGGASYTPKRIYQTDWKVVEKWSTSISLSEIDRQIDAILARCLRSAGYVVEHVAKTKDTDRSYWKEAHVSSLFNVAIGTALLMRIPLCAGYSQRQMFQEIYRFVPMSP